uniref:Uncharacterized protein n=1 Tax=Arion vulgaris TaxID=1028688 RepID=A0A0B7B0G2_9EUPU
MENKILPVVCSFDINTHVNTIQQYTAQQTLTHTCCILHSRHTHACNNAIISHIPLYAHITNPLAYNYVHIGPHTQKQLPIGPHTQ